jgi:hypothetical protein
MTVEGRIIRTLISFSTALQGKRWLKKIPKGGPEQSLVTVTVESEQRFIGAQARSFSDISI